MGDIPTAVLYHLPEWCIYIPTPGRSWNGASLYGFFAHLEHNRKLQLTELRFVLDVSACPGDRLVLMPIRLGIGGVAESLDVLLTETVRNVPVLMDARDCEPETLRRDVPPLVSLVLYLCCQCAEIADGQGSGRLPERPQPVKTKRACALSHQIARPSGRLDTALGPH